MARAPAVLDIVVFGLGRQRFGLMIDDVERVLPAVASTPLPNAPAIIEGVINIAGAPVAVLDIRKRFGLRLKPVEVDDVLIITLAADRRVAIRADRVVGLVKVDPADVRDAKTIAPMDPQIAGVATLPGGVVLIHDPRVFLTQAEAVELAALMATEFGCAMTATLAPSSLDDALDYFTAQTGLVFPAPRRVDFEAAARRAMARRNMRDLNDLPDAIRLDRRLLDELVTELAVHESYFFREPAQFAAIRRLVLPQLQRERGLQALLNIWSAGCAKGEEPYSLALLLEQEGLLGRCRIRATDISRAALAEAAKARYSGWSFRGTQVAFDRRYFRQRGASFQLEARIRDLVTFDVLNLVSGPYASPQTGTSGFDLILCRNVLIYFEAPTVARVARWLHDALGDGGWLITAPADPPLWDYAPFDTQTTPEGILYRRRSAKPTRGARAAAPARASRMPTVQAPAVAGKTPVDGGEKRLTPRSHTPASDEGACLVRIKALANSAGSAAAEQLATASAALHPMSPALHYLRAILLLDLNRPDEALTAVRRILYLDRTLIAAHLLLGSMLRTRGDLRGASRAYSNALQCCASHPPDGLAEMTDGERVGRLAALAAAEIATLEGLEPRT